MQAVRLTSRGSYHLLQTLTDDELDAEERARAEKAFEAIEDLEPQETEGMVHKETPYVLANVNVFRAASHEAAMAWAESDPCNACGGYSDRDVFQWRVLEEEQFKIARKDGKDMIEAITPAGWGPRSAALGDLNMLSGHYVWHARSSMLSCWQPQANMSMLFASYWPLLAMLTGVAFVIYARDKPGATELRANTRDAHLSWLADSGRVHLAGPLLSPDGAASGSLLVVAGEDLEEVRDWAASDPYAHAGVFGDTTIALAPEIMVEEALPLFTW